VDTVRATYPPHEQERFVAHLRGLIGQWVREQGPDGVHGPTDAERSEAQS
jgi:hypothetical protein